MTIEKITLTNETTLNVVTSGTQEPTLIFLHFWGGSSRTFSPLFEILSPSHRCIAIDFPGWGSSTGPQTTEAYTIRSLASTVESILPLLKVQDFVLVGHSMGGKVAQLIAGRGSFRDPQRLKGLVLIAPAPPTPFELPGPMKEQQIMAYDSAENAAFITQNVLSTSHLPDQTVQIVVEDMMNGNALAKKAWPEYAMAEDILEEARKIKTPVLVVAGELDKVEVLDRLRNEVLGNIEGSELVVVKGVGHLMMLENPVIMAGHISDFVKKIEIK